MTSWLPAASMTTGALCAAARDRRQVVLRDGRTARLVCWQPRGARTKARVQFAAGTAATISILEVVGVEPDPTRNVCDQVDDGDAPL